MARSPDTTECINRTRRPPQTLSVRETCCYTRFNYIELEKLEKYQQLKEEIEKV